ncbi:MutS domain V [Colletotrichum higginsianum IMI 349063]|uniref:DNA mismatch repair protein MSH5 n=1 Tax=Colletotrichum higginsianum (strain IMI 349063) TaxID=759273 RepID=A0A1B7XZJ9_COLHI|nr:MutS domain V [Colletotrichum higginsianum IMI 349063]OBR05161.1 MutS domain V [Colletotrichum higginsianum IMI 349063]
MPGRGRTNFGPWRGRPRPGGGSGRGLRGDSRGGSWSSSERSPMEGPRETSRAPARSRARSTRASRGSRDASSLIGPTPTSPIFSTPHSARQQSDAIQRSATSRAERIEGNDVLRLVPDHSLPHYGSRSTPSSGLEGHPFIRGRSLAEADRMKQVIIAISVGEMGVLGCAYYDSDEGHFFLLQDMPCTEPLQFIETIIVHCQPTTVLLPLRIPDAVLQFLEQHNSTVDRDSVAEQYTIRLLGSNEFSHAASLDKLTGLSMICTEHALVTNSDNQFAHDGIEGTQAECHNVKVMRLGTFIDLDSVMSIRCAGAVLSDITRLGDIEQPPGFSENTFITSIRMFTLTDFMFVNADTLSSLQVFQSELHPNSLMSGTGIAATGLKESLSLYGIFHPLAGTFQGKAKLRQLFLRPLVNIEVIQERHKTISVLLRPGNEEAFAEISKTLRKVTDIKKALVQLKRGAESPTSTASVERGVWWTLTRFALSMLRLRDAVLQLQEGHDIAVFRQMIEATPVVIIKSVGELVGTTVDFEETKASSRVAVRWNVNPQLDRLKQTYHGLDSLLSDVSTSMSRKLPEWAQKYVTGCVFWPQLGFLTVVPLLPNTGEAGYEGQGLNEDRWDKRFVANGNVYYKNRCMLELDDQFGDTYSRIVDLEVEILHNLACQVLKYESTLSRASEACGELDCLVALAKGALNYGWTNPTMTTDNVVSVQGGRHPLQELTVPKFIPNDCQLAGGSGGEVEVRMEVPVNENPKASMLVVTGPNHSGKSVYIKQVALIVYMAHIGSFVPADSATVGITDQILTRISTRESVSLAESSFGTDLRQVAFLLKHSTRRTLVAIDEFGKGTATDDGSGLMTALIDHFTALGSQTPRVLITTHCHEIFEDGYLGDRSGLFLAHMDVRLDLETKHTEDQVVAMYCLVPGRSMSSFGSRCAALNGVNTAVVERAEAIVLLLARNEDLGVACAKLDAEAEARLKGSENVARKFLQLSLENTRTTRPQHGAVTGEEPVRNLLQRLLKVNIAV